MSTVYSTVPLGTRPSCPISRDIAARTVYCRFLKFHLLPCRSGGCYLTATLERGALPRRLNQSHHGNYRMAHTPSLTEQDIVEVLTGRGQRIVTAESCSGGLIAHRLTNVPGASACFWGGIIAYSNEMKELLLGVPAESLATHGAVSESTARAMAAGARTRYGVDYGLSVTGVAGPSGGTEEKPVGLVYVALAGPAGVTARRFRFEGNRAAVKGQTADAALALLWEVLST